MNRTNSDGEARRAKREGRSADGGYELRGAKSEARTAKRTALKRSAKSVPGRLPLNPFGHREIDSPSRGAIRAIRLIRSIRIAC